MNLYVYTDYAVLFIMLAVCFGGAAYSYILSKRG
jgi:hypothetical protein